MALEEVVLAWSFSGLAFRKFYLLARLHRLLITV